MQNSLTHTAKYFDVFKKHVSSLRMADCTHYSQERIPVLAHSTHNAYPGVKHPYSRMHMPSNMG